MKLFELICALFVVLMFLLMIIIHQTESGPMAEMRAFRLGQSLTRPPLTVWVRVFYPFPINVVEEKYVPVKVPIPVPVDIGYPSQFYHHRSARQFIAYY